MDSDDDTTGSWQWEDRETDSETEDETDTVDKRTDSESGLRACIKRVRNTDNEWVVFGREVLSSLAVVAVIGLLLFAMTGLWPPAVVVESGSMQPNLQRGDFVVIVEEHRFTGGAVHDGTGVVTYRTGATVGYKTFNRFGDVIIYERNGNGQQTPIVHRARFWVGAGDNWYDEADQDYLSGADNCRELTNCPAEHAGFITKGDNNIRYDQVGVDPISEPVKPSWIVGRAELRIPWLGHIKLLFEMIF